MIGTTANFDKEATDVLIQKSQIIHHRQDLQHLINKISTCKIVMLGEATHGTHEFYTWRSYISQKLITDHHFNFIAVEGDWPDCYQINRFIKGKEKKGNNATDILTNFDRWPTWMWANWEVAAFIEWLYQHNKHFSANQKIGFFGLDVYSLWDSLQSIIQHLIKVDDAALTKALQAFRCFEPYKESEGSGYGYAAQLVPNSCESQVVDLLKEIQHKRALFDGEEEHIFNTEQNARIAVNAEKYYRAMVKGGPQSWNIRDQHMADTLQQLLLFHGPGAKAIVWEHNTHIGDAKATDMADEGMYNIGELARHQFGEENVALIGFGTYKGSVIAGNQWGAPMQVMDVPEAKESSWEYLLHQAGDENRLVYMNDLKDTIINERRIGHRAIGVVYRPAYEQYGNYASSIMPQRYDAFIHIDTTTALHPLHLKSKEHQIRDTYPFGM